MTNPGDMDLAHLRKTLGSYSPKVVAGSADMAQSAVAMVLRESPTVGAEILMVRRASRAGDPWSGQMAFPGGRREPVDRSMQDVAERETIEEVGFDLKSSARCLGRISEIQARSRGGLLPLCIHPFVYEMVGEAAFSYNEEVDETLWVPLGFLRDPSNRRSLTLQDSDGKRTLPAYRFSERVIWGLSLAMLDELVFGLGGADAPDFLPDE